MYITVCSPEKITVSRPSLPGATMHHEIRKPYIFPARKNPSVFLLALISVLTGCIVALIILPYEFQLNQDADTFVEMVMQVLRLFLIPLVAVLMYFFLKEKYRVRQIHINADRLETLLKNLPGMAYRCFNRKNWPMDFVSEGCKALCGYDRSELEEQRVLWGSFTHPDEIEPVERSILEAVANDEPFEVEYRIITRDGDIKWVWERGCAVGVMNGETILEGLITDINDRKLAEQALMQAESYAKAVVDAAVEAVITTDDRGYIETSNRAAQKMFDYSGDMLTGRNILVLLPETYHEDYEEFVTHYLSTNESQMVGMGHEFTGKRRDNSEFPIHLSISKVQYESECKKYVFLVRDLSAQRAAEKEVREQREQLAHVDRLNTLGEMASVIAHEINQPLTAISMYAQSSLHLLDNDRISGPRKLRDALEKLIVQARRAGSVIERVQQMSRQQSCHSEKVDCNALIKDVHKLAEVEAHIRDIVITLKLSRLLPTIECDPVQIQQVILNLLRNGMESMKKAGFRNGNRIILRTSRTATGVKISVIDSGNGINDKTMEQIYKPFSTTKDTGMGMGLSISRSIIRAHGGQLEYINNSNNCGVTFYFTLPFRQQISNGP